MHFFALGPGSTGAAPVQFTDVAIRARGASGVEADCHVARDVSVRRGPVVRT